MAHTRIKICGITKPKDARIVAESGADALGLVFYAKSPRAVTVEQAAACVKVVPPFLSIVALFVDASVEEIDRVIKTVPVDLIQFHGDESPAFCRQFGRPYIKALRVKPSTDIVAASQSYSDARGILLDAWQQGVPGGTGKTFDWDLARGNFSRPMVLAGGLNPGNVAAAIDRVRPDGVDVSGGVELEPGIKSVTGINEFIAAVRAADQRLDGLRHE